MASHIHLVDDQDEDNDDNMYGWERNEDPNAPLTTRSGILGLEGMKWLHQQRRQEMQEQQDSNAEGLVDAEGKPIVDNNLRRPSLGGDASIGGGQSVQSTVQRSRTGRKSSAGRILTVSARERRQMLEAEYYATHTLPTTIRFVDTQGVPHQRTVGRGMTDSSISGPSGTSDLNEQPGFMYGTEGYYSTINRRDFINMRKESVMYSGPNHGGVGIDRRGTMYGAGSTQLPDAVQTHQSQHQPLIKFDSPNSSMRDDGGQPSTGPNRDRQSRSDDRRVSGTGYIPSCIDVFRQGQQQQSARREDPSRQGYTLLPDQGSPISRVRSNSWDQSAGNQRQGPSPNEIHRWLAESAGTLQGPSFNIVQRTSESGPQDVEYGVRRPRPSQSSDITRVTSPPLGANGESIHDYSHRAKERNSAGQHGPGTVKEEQRYHREGIAPDEMPMPLSAEPATMNAEEEAAFHADHDTLQNDNAPGPGPRVPPQGFIARVHEPTMPTTSSSSSGTATPVGDIPRNLLLGGGTGARYGPHAYGVPLPGSVAEDDAGLRGRSRQRSEGHYLSPASSEVLQVSDDDGDYDGDHQQIMRATADHRPPSLFSNHPQSGQSSRAPSCAGSAHHSRPSSVLMTIFDEPVLNLPRSRSISRTDSVLAAAAGSLQPRPRTVSETPLMEADRSDRAQRSSGQSSTGPAASRPSIQSNASEVSIGPFDETRNPETLPHFEQDVDLNHLELEPEQYEQERRRRADLIRREREVEARLARLGAKGRGDYD
ncbi:hypothetical protein EDD21DRAFT_238757 [Dissophora ornata]|nr:hypothetical protein EDD21DRAFT_238757 [Dissophora ornata]